LILLTLVGFDGSGNEGAVAPFYGPFININSPYT
jgi:hypothetical protein